MLEFLDCSSRRGVLVPLIPKLHAMLTENATKDKTSGMAPPEHLITWRQKINAQLVDINRRFIYAMDNGSLAGIFFYRYQGTDIYIEDVQIAWTHRTNPQILEGMIKKLEYDGGARGATYFASDRIKIEANEEILAAVYRKESLRQSVRSVAQIQKELTKPGGSLSMNNNEEIQLEEAGQLGSLSLIGGTDGMDGAGFPLEIINSSTAQDEDFDSIGDSTAGWEELGDFSKAMGILKHRYNRSSDAAGSARRRII